MTTRELKLDYFRIYYVENRQVQAKASIQGQFDREPDVVQLTVLDYFANPTVYRRSASLVAGWRWFASTSRLNPHSECGHRDIAYGAASSARSPPSGPSQLRESQLLAEGSYNLFND